MKEIGRLKLLRRYLKGHQLRDVLNRLREMGRHPLSQGDFLVLENCKGRRNVIRIMPYHEAMDLLHSQHDRDLSLIPLRGSSSN